MYDAVVIGAGINGLVAAAELAAAGWSVALVDEHERLGGFIASDELTEPGFIHDTFSSWHPLFVAGPAYAALGADLHRHGLEYANSDELVTASVSEHGTALAHRDPERTAAALHDPRDRDAYLAMVAQMQRWAPHVFGALASEFGLRRLISLGASTVRDLGPAESAELLRAAVQSGRGLLRERFHGWEVDQLWTPWLLHAGLSPDHASGGVMLPVMALTMHTAGLPVVVGGAGRFVDAFRQLLDERGVDLLTATRAERIETDHGRARAVLTDRGRLVARRAVLVSSSTQRLHRELLADVPGSRPPHRGRSAESITPRTGRAAMQIHLALDTPVQWRDERLRQVPLVHLSDGAAGTGIACAQAEAGLLPSMPTVAVGQQGVLDAGRAPAGRATLWLQLQELPFAPRGDAAGELDVTRGWDEALTGGYLDRVLARIEPHAPGFRATVSDARVISPRELQARNANAVDGDPYGGPGELDTSLVWRPRTGRGHTTPVQDLFHIGAFTHPGPGLGGGSGHLVAQRLTAERRSGSPRALRDAVRRLATRPG